MHPLDFIDRRERWLADHVRRFYDLHRVLLSWLGILTGPPALGVLLWAEYQVVYVLGSRIPLSGAIKGGVLGVFYYFTFLAWLKWLARRVLTERGIAELEWWWVPPYCFRVVAQNIEGRGRWLLADLEWRVWARRNVGPSHGADVITFDDTDVGEGHRLLLPPGNDLPLLCFKLKPGSVKELLPTDKMGRQLAGRNHLSSFDELFFEYSFEATVFGFRHRVRRLYVIPSEMTGISVWKYAERIQERNEERQLISLYRVQDETVSTL